MPLVRNKHLFNTTLIKTLTLFWGYSFNRTNKQKEQISTLFRITENIFKKQRYL